MEQYYNITGLAVKMDSFGRTVTQAEPYLTEPAEPVDIVIGGDWKQLQKNQPHLSDEDCEYLVTGSSFYRQLLNFDGMLTLNQSGVLLWQALEKGCSEAELTEVLLAEYEVSPEEAAADAREFLNTLIQAGCLDA